MRKISVADLDASTIYNMDKILTLHDNRKSGNFKNGNNQNSVVLDSWERLYSSLKMQNNMSCTDVDTRFSHGL